MANKNLLAALLSLIFIGSAYANLQEKLVAKSTKINATKQNIREGKVVTINNGCKEGCKAIRCRSCAEFTR